jgi:hypothetical protein
MVCSKERWGEKVGTLGIGIVLMRKKIVVVVVVVVVVGRAMVVGE